MSDGIDVPFAMRNVLQQLQQEPQRYKLFGVYWWPVKEQLKLAGYGPDQLYMLGNYKDHMTAELVPEMNLQDTLRAAFEEYRFNAVFPHSDGRVEDPDGQLVTIYDEDAGF
jgi:hypothetical protein